MIFKKSKNKLDKSILSRLEFIYSFWNSISKYAYARKEDNVIILPPNLVYKTNRTAVDILNFISSGGRLEDIPDIDNEKLVQVEAFFVSLKAAYDGKNVYLENIPYSFDFTKLPVLGEIAVTYKCNNRCRFCYAGCGDSFPEPNELSTEQFKKVIDIFKDEAKIPFFSFTGGEPLTRPDIEELSAYAISRGLRVNLVTNARYATKERAESLFASGLQTAQVSLEAPTAEIHDYLCNCPGAFSETIEGIKNLKNAGFSVQTNSTLTKYNMNALLDLPAFVKDLGAVRMSMNLFIPVGTGLNSEGLFFPYEEAGAFIDEVRKIAQKTGIEFMWYSPIPICQYNTIARGLGNKSCAACDGLLSISPEGNILPCSSYPEPIGNILKDGFSKLWFSEKAMFFKNKKYAPKECSNCKAFIACQSACPLYWKYAGTSCIKKLEVFNDN